MSVVVLVVFGVVVVVVVFDILCGCSNWVWIMSSFLCFITVSKFDLILD